MKRTCSEPKCEREAIEEGFFARCLIHEVIHLRGIVEGLSSKLNRGTVTLRFDMEVPEPE